MSKLKKNGQKRPSYKSQRFLFYFCRFDNRKTKFFRVHRKLLMFNNVFRAFKTKKATTALHSRRPHRRPRRMSRTTTCHREV